MNLLDLFEFKKKTIEAQELTSNALEEAYQSISSGPIEPNILVITPDLYLEIEERLFKSHRFVEEKDSDGNIYQIRERFTRYRNAHVAINPIIPIRELWFINLRQRENENYNVRLKFLGKIYKND